MLCTRCEQKQANVFFSQSINGQSEQYSLCEDCAKAMGIFEKGAGLFDTNKAFSAGDFINSLVGELRPYKALTQEAVPQCSECGMTYPEFTKVGRFGCANCYEAFGELLPPVLKRFHGSDEHIGKVPGRAEEATGAKHELENLRKELKDAIAAEEYEKAAELRDEIKRLENN